MNKNMIDINMTELLESAKRLLEQLKRLSETIGVNKYVVASEDYVNVGSENGLNGTDFTPKSPVFSVKAQIFNSEEDAMLMGMDYYLVNGNGEKIIPQVIPAKQFFSEEMIVAERIIQNLKSVADQ